jgi:hypothetical protein
LTVDNCADLEKLGALEKEYLPATIRDAMRFCTLIGERYLWLDRLCIIQDDASSKHQQIQSMAYIYQNAALTIIAASGKDTSFGLPGIRPRRNFVHKSDSFQVDVGKSVWNERAWTFQEYHLSKKCVFFTPSQVYFQCRKGFWFEQGLHKYMSAGKNENLLSKNQSPMENFGKAVTQYNTRKITYTTDILDAFVGVGTVLAQEMNTSLLLGLPESEFIWGLLWLPVGSCTKRIGTGLPTWTWLSWQCHVSFLGTSFGECNVEIYHQDTAIGLRRVVPVPEKASSDTLELPSDTIEIARNNPGCLLFSSTVIACGTTANASLYRTFSPSITDENGEVVGHLWMSEESSDCPPLQQLGLVTIAFKKRKGRYSPELRDTSHVYIMLINRKNEVSKRIAVGWVYKYWWDKAEKVTQRIVLI